MYRIPTVRSYPTRAYVFFFELRICSRIDIFKFKKRFFYIGIIYLEFDKEMLNFLLDRYRKLIDDLIRKKQEIDSLKPKSSEFRIQLQVLENIQKEVEAEQYNLASIRATLVKKPKNLPHLNLEDVQTILTCEYEQIERMKKYGISIKYNFSPFKNSDDLV